MLNVNIDRKRRLSLVWRGVILRAQLCSRGTCASCTSGSYGGRNEAPPGRRCRPSLPSVAFSSEEGVASRLQLDVVASLLALGRWPRERRSAPSRATASTPWSCTAGARWRLKGRRPVALLRPHAHRRDARRSSGGRALRAAGSALLPVPYSTGSASRSGTPPRQERGGQIRVSLGRSTARVA